LKTCTRCGIEKSLKNFYRKKQAIDGHMSECKICTQIRNKQAYEENKKTRRHYDKVYQLENKLKLQEYRKNYRDKNKEKAKGAYSQYRELHKDKLNANHREWWEQNKEIINEWRRINKHLSAAQSAKRRTMKRQATPWWSESEQIKEIYNKAREITVETGVQHHVDHIVPLKGVGVQGLHVIANLRIIPYYENLSKSNKLIEDIV
jgi:hypothetical protein